MSYLAGAFVLGAAGAFVEGAVDWSDPDWLQPVSSTLAARPISTIRVISLFIVAVTLTKTVKRTSKKLILLYWGLVGGCRSSPTMGSDLANSRACWISSKSVDRFPKRKCGMPL